MIEAGGLITAKEAERRGPGDGEPRSAGTIQSHHLALRRRSIGLAGRGGTGSEHSQSALRFVLEGFGAHTSVNGEKTIMEVGDLVITPPMAWHDHGNETDAPMFWLDGLDIPLVSFLDASAAEVWGRTSSR